MNSQLGDSPNRVSSAPQGSARQGSGESLAKISFLTYSTDVSDYFYGLLDSLVVFVVFNSPVFYSKSDFKNCTV